MSRQTTITLKCDGTTLTLDVGNGVLYEALPRHYQFEDTYQLAGKEVVDFLSDCTTDRLIRAVGRLSAFYINELVANQVQWIEQASYFDERGCCEAVYHDQLAEAIQLTILIVN